MHVSAAEHIKLPDDTVEEWQRITDILVCHTAASAAAICRLRPDGVEEVCRTPTGETQEGGVSAPGDWEEAIRDGREVCGNGGDCGTEALYALPVKWPNADMFGAIAVWEHDGQGLQDDDRELVARFKHALENRLELLYREAGLETDANRTETAGESESGAIAPRDLQSFLDRVPVPFMLHTEDGEVLTINQRWTELTGYDVDEVPTVNEWLDKGYGGDEEDRVDKHIDSVFTRGGRRRERHFPVSCADGSRRVWDIRSVHVGNEAGGRRIMASVAADITERKRADRRATRLQNLLAATRDVNQIVMQGSEPEETFLDACRSLAQNRSYRACCVAVLDEDDGYISPVACAGAHEVFADDWAVTPAGDGRGPACVVQAVGSGRIYVTRPGSTAVTAGTQREIPL